MHTQAQAAGHISNACKGHADGVNPFYAFITKSHMLPEVQLWTQLKAARGQSSYVSVTTSMPT